MNLVSFALRRPVSILVLVVAAVATGLLALTRMPRDIFPDLGVPTLYVAQPYGGMDPAQMEGYLTYYYEYHFLYITGIEHVESKSIQGAALIKLQFHPGTNMAAAMAETVSYVNRARAFMPPGTIPPFVMRFDAGSVPVGQLVFSGDPSVQLKDLQDAALNRVRPLFATLPGVSAPPPFGGSPRAIVVNVDPDRLRSLNMAPEEVVAAVARGNLISPSGNVRIGDMIPMVPINSVAPDARTFMDIPIRMDGTRTIYVRDIGSVADSADIQTAFALVNGKRTVYMPVTKRADASTLSVVSLVKANLPEFQKVLEPLPGNIKVSYEFDQSPYVVRAIEGLSEEGVLGAILTGLMVLLFLRDWRSALVVVLNIPLSLVAAAIVLWLSGQTVNIMTLGGLALAVGILVDEATVTIENVHTHLGRGASAPRAASDATRETTGPRFLAMLCILAVFIPAFFMQGPARSLFVPLALAVGFSMVASYLLSSTLVPVLCVWLLRSGHHGGEAVAARRGFGVWATNVYSGLTGWIVRWRWLVVPLYLVAAGAVIYFLTPTLGREIFPIVDTGQFTIRLRAATGTRIEKTEQLARQMLAVINREVAGDTHDDGIQISIGLVGVHAGAYPVNLIHLWTSGPEEGVLSVQLNPKYAVRVELLKERLRQILPAEMPGVRFSFEPSDIVSRVMSFGSPTPVEVAVSGANFAADRQFAARLKDELAKIPSLRDLQYGQELDYPAIKVEVDRERAGAMGVTEEQVARSLTEATSSSRLVTANYWADPKSGVAYQVQVQVPVQRMNSLEEIRNLPIATIGGAGSLAAGGAGQLQVGEVANVTSGTVLGEYDRYNMARMLTLDANISGADLGRVASQLQAAVQRAGELPAGVKVDVRGQVPAMQELFTGLTNGLAVAIAVVFLLLAANFQSFRLSLAVILTMPAVVAGVAIMLHFTHTTLNIQSFMGAIMAVGVAVANAILLLTFAERYRAAGMTTRKAAAEGAASRLRPILMTSCAMIAGMMPMALGLGQGGAQTAPLGRAVIGGLAAATVTTLLILPAIFALLQRDHTRKTASIDPDDPQSPYHQTAKVKDMSIARSPVVVLLATCAALALSAHAGFGQSVPATSAASPGSAAPPTKTVAATATLEAFDSADLYAKDSGYLSEVKADLGDHVRQGQVLAVIDDPELQNQLDSAQAVLAARQEQATASQAAVEQTQKYRDVAKSQLAGYQAELTLAKATLARQEELFAAKAITSQQLDEVRARHQVAAAQADVAAAKVAAAEADIAAAQANLAVAKAQVPVAAAEIQRLKTLLTYTRITAPFDGIITRRLVSKGDLVQSGVSNRATPLFTCQRLDTIRVFCDVPETGSAAIVPGTAATVKIFALNNQSVTATVSRVATSLNASTRTMRTEIDLPNPDEKLRPGMYAQVTFIIDAKP